MKHKLVYSTKHSSQFVVIDEDYGYGAVALFFRANDSGRLFQIHFTETVPSEIQRAMAYMSALNREWHYEE